MEPGTLTVLEEDGAGMAMFLGFGCHVGKATASHGALEMVSVRSTDGDDDWADPDPSWADEF